MGGERKMAWVMLTVGYDQHLRISRDVNQIKQQVPKAVDQDLGGFLNSSAVMASRHSLA